MKKASCIFSGRIGNNLFQLANLLSFSCRFKRDWVISDKSHYWINGAKVEYIIPWEIFDYNFYHHITLEECKMPIFTNKYFDYKAHPLWIKFVNVNFRGYYQSYRYFQDIRNELVYNYFLPNKDIQKMLLRFEVEENSVGISVRRGDYLKLQELHTVLTMRYYEDAIDFIENKFGTLKRIYVFSDDLDWCRINFEDDRYQFIEGSIGEVFFKMTKMKSLVLSNSTFAWWGAYLNLNCKCVIYPRDWYGPKNFDKFSEDLFPDDWIGI